MMRLKVLIPLIAVGLALIAQPTYAHGFGERYDLPVPLGYFLVGAGAAVALSFAVIGLFVKGDSEHGNYWRFNLFEHRWSRAILAGPVLTWTLKLLSVFLLGLVVATGFFGSQTPSLNFSPTFIWVIWWVGMGFVAALVGNLWALINPWKILYDWAEVLYAKSKPGRRLSVDEAYPQSWGMWPALLLFLAFAWAESVYPESSLPSRLAVMTIVYSAFTWGGMVLFGKHQWLRHGEAFSVVFGFLTRFAPSEVRVRGSELCRVCDGDCLSQDGNCINCYECFEKALAIARPEAAVASNPGHSRPAELNIRPFAMGLIKTEGVTVDVLAVVILLLSTVTFDGFSAVPAWVDVQSFSLDIFSGSINTLIVNGITIADTIGLLLFPVAFLLVYLTFCYFMYRVVGDSLGVLDLAQAFVYSLIPIALAYNIAHFLTLLVIQGQLLIPLVSDPFGQGWNLFGTAGYTVDIGVINAKIVWFLSISVIVVGHILAVYLAHRISMRLFKSRPTALRSQYPMLALMVIYTVLSLWIIAQPIVE